MNTITMMRRLLGGLLGMTLLSATPVLAEYRVDERYYPDKDWPPRRIETPVRVEIVDEYGRRLPQYPLRRGEGALTRRAYLEARQSLAYSIQVENPNPFRVGLVIAVDGRNILSGDRSELAPEERMYVLEPHQRASYRGWRSARDRINEFYFTDAPDSYAGRWGDYSAMGVIALAAYRERARPPVQAYGQRESGKDRAAAPQSAPLPGTGHGEARYDPSRLVRFIPERQPLSRIFLKYEWPETLCERGIGECGYPDNRFWEEPARYRRDERFVPPPPSVRRR